MNACYFHPDEVTALLGQMVQGCPSASLVDQQGRVLEGILCGSTTPLRVALAPQHWVGRPIPGQTVCLSVRDGQGVTDFYTQVKGEENGVWALEIPRVLRRIGERRSTTRVAVSEGDGLHLQVLGGGVGAVLDVSRSGLAVRCQVSAPWARLRRPFEAMLSAEGVEPIRLRVEIHHLQLDPGRKHARIAGAKVSLVGPGAQWWKDWIAVLERPSLVE
jgi:hypothetical protein